MQAEKDPAASFAPTPQTSTSQRALTEAAEQSEDKIEEVADAAERQIMASTRKAREEWRSLQKAVGHMWTALLQQELQTSDGWTTTALRTCERLFRLGFVKKQYASIPILAPTSLLASLEVALSPKFDVEAQAATQELGNFLNSVVSGSLTDKGLFFFARSDIMPAVLAEFCNTCLMQTLLRLMQRLTPCAAILTSMPSLLPSRWIQLQDLRSHCTA
eukprot:INCI14986.1.p1 GENE.INCI14986.1~~INCI14986.1.p1  ORF type:complete len:217 (-),score=34.25 INCI14986.1:203-853(-)